MASNKEGNSLRLNEIKQSVLEQILSTPEITVMIDKDKDPSEMLYDNIFPFSKIPGIVDTAKVYITIDVSMPDVSRINNFFKDVIVTITIICHDDLMKTDVGMTRIDYLGIVIERIFNKKATLGIGESEIISNVEGAWTERHSYRELRFRTKDFNGNKCNFSSSI